MKKLEIKNNYENINVRMVLFSKILKLMEKYELQEQNNDLFELIK